MSVKRLNKINIFIFRMVIYVLFGCAAAYGQSTVLTPSKTTEKVPSVLRLKKIDFSSATVKVDLGKFSALVTPKKKLTDGTQTLLNPLRVGLGSKKFDTYYPVNLKSGFVYYTLRDPLKFPTNAGLETVNIGFAFTANF